MTGDPAPAHRLVLGAVELADLVRRTGGRLPPPFGPGAEDSDPPDSDPHGSGGPSAVHPSVAANLAILARPEVAIRTEASLAGGRSRAVFAVAGPLGASLFALADGAVELSMFPAVALGAELVRAVPDEPDRDLVTARVIASLGGASEDLAQRPAGRVDWAGLVDYESTRAFGGSPALTAAEAELAARAAARTRGILNCLVFGRVGPDVAVGQAVWIATDAGWVGLAPSVGSDGRRVVELRPVNRADLGTWLAPFIAQILDGSDDAGS